MTNHRKSTGPKQRWSTSRKAAARRSDVSGPRSGRQGGSPDSGKARRPERPVRGDPPREAGRDGFTERRQTGRDRLQGDARRPDADSRRRRDDETSRAGRSSSEWQDRRGPSGRRSESATTRYRDDRPKTPRDRRETPRDRRAPEGVVERRGPERRPQRRASERPFHRERVRDEDTRVVVDTGFYGERRPEKAPVEVAGDNGFGALGLPEKLVERLARDGITAPFPIQQATIPDALAGRDVLGRGQTGSGKTMAFALPTLARLDGGRAKRNRPRSLVLVPTRELAMQVSDAILPLAQVLGLRHKLVAGGMPYQPQIDALERGVDVLIATPGRLQDLVDRGACNLDSVEIAILDEADHMAEMGFLPEITALLDRIPPGGQRLLFSATLDRGIDTVVERYLKDPVTHEADPGTASVSTMEHHVLLVEPQHKQSMTAELAGRPGRTVVFVRTKLGADRVAMQLRQQGVVAAALHGGLGQGQRNRVLNAFRGGRIPVLVATDVAARGIHVDDVTAVIQVDPPADHKDYLHRSGRTARAGERGTVVTLALPHQRATMRRLAREAGLDVKLRQVAPGDTELREATGAVAPTGEPLTDEDFQRLIAEPRRPRPQGRPRRQGRPRPGGGPRRRG